ATPVSAPEPATPPPAISATAPPTGRRGKGSVADCRVTAPDLVPIRSGKLSAKVTAMSNSCITLFEPLVGTLTIKWKAARTTPILPTSSTMTLTNVSFTGYAAPWGAAYGQFSLGTNGVTGAFTGGDNGAAASNTSITSQSINDILAGCSSPAGLHTINTGLGQITLK